MSDTLTLGFDQEIPAGNPLNFAGPAPIVPVASGRPDDFQTPDVALLPLLPYLSPGWHIWEPSCGKGNIVRFLTSRGFLISGTDIKDGQDFFRICLEFDAIVTNPPYSCKDDYLERCYDLGSPFALLMPITSLEGRRRQSLYRKHGLEVIFLDRRINFETPSGKGTGSWFSTAWFTWGMGIGHEMTFAHLNPALTTDTTGVLL